MEGESLYEEYNVYERTLRPKGDRMAHALPLPLMMVFGAQIWLYTMNPFAAAFLEALYTPTVPQSEPLSGHEPE